MSLDSERVLRSTVVPTTTHPYGQPGLVVGELVTLDEVVKADVRWQEAMRSRGVTDLTRCKVLPAVGRAVRVPRRGRPPGDARHHALPGGADRHPVDPPHRGRHRLRRPDRAARPPLRRPRRRPDPAAPAQPRRRRVGAGAHEPAAARHHPAGRAQLPRRRRRRRVGGLVVPGRLRRSRRPRAAPARLRRRRSGPPDHPPGVGVRDGRALRRPAPDALLDQLLRRGRVRPRPPGQHAHARLRLPRRDPLLRRRLRRRPGPAGRAPEGRVPARGGRRRAVEAPGLLQRHQRGAPLAPPRRLVVGGDRELRLRLLLVPVPGRHDRVRHQAHRDRVRRRQPRRRRPRRAGHARAGRAVPPAPVQRAPRHDGRRRAQHRRGGRRRRRRGRRREPLRQRLHHPHDGARTGGRRRPARRRRCARGRGGS